MSELWAGLWRDPEELSEARHQGILRNAPVEGAREEWEPHKETNQKAGTDARPWNWRRTALERCPRSDVQMNVGGERGRVQGGRRTHAVRKGSSPPPSP